MKSFVRRVRQWAESLESLNSEGLVTVALDLGFQARQSESLSVELIEQAFALVQVSAHRHLGMTHYDVQLLGGLAMARGQVIEMRTGEGKTLTATLPLFSHALSKRGVLLATTNDYLAKRDATEMSRIYTPLGLSVGVIQADMSREQRRASYQCDITYGTMNEFGFDFLRDCSAKRQQQQRAQWYGSEGIATSNVDGPVQRRPHFLLIDEADSILIDDARTPLILSAPASEAERAQAAALYQWSATQAPHFSENDHYWYDRERHKVELTPAGTRFARGLARPESLAGVGLIEIYDYLERAIQVYRDRAIDRDYIVRDGEIVIVDESTGRIAEGRRWSKGVHQAIEAKERVEITGENTTLAKVTVQSLARRFPHLAGMTGTALSAAHEFKKFYRCPVSVIPPNRPSQRVELPAKFAFHEIDKFRMIVDDVLELHQIGRPVLIGTRSIDTSERLSKAFTSANVEHVVLHARLIERESEIVAQAGQRGRITVATNMAGRGTDIKIDDSVRALGGLHVIGTEFHESSRIDQQLFGRCGRQGDPGSVRQYFSAEDKLLETAFGLQKAIRLKAKGKRNSVHYWQRLFKLAQRKIESQHYRARRILMYNEKELIKSQREMGLDPILDNYE